MLHTISWVQYWTALSFLTLAWYGYVILRFYRPSFKTTKPSLPFVASVAVIGGIKAEHATLNAEELSFGNSMPDDISDQTLAPGPTEELLSETQSLVDAFRDTPNKTEFLSLLGVLLSKYEPYQDEIDLKVICPLASQLPFPIEEHEWPKF